jgi:exopolysaccharide biosynthesis protein
MRRLLLFLFLATSSAFAQNSDSLTLVNAQWQRQKIARQTKLMIYHFNQKNLFNDNQNISFLVVKPSKKSPKISLGYAEKELKGTSTFAQQNSALAAINGTFFDVKNGGSVDFIKVNGKTISPNQLGKNQSRARHQQAAIAIDNGKLSIKKWDGTANWEDNLKEAEIMASGPLLVYQQKDEFLDTTAFNRLRHPRSAVGVRKNGEIILLTVDGRNENSAGMSLFELTKVMRWLGCVDAINLDGGGSTTLWVNKFGANGVVNFPSDNKKWDHEGERKVANVILLKEKQ